MQVMQMNSVPPTDMKKKKRKEKTQFCVHCVIAMVSSWHAGNVMG